MLEQSLLNDLETLGWRIVDEENSCVLYSDKSTRAGNFHYERRGSIESDLYGYIEIKENKKTVGVEAILFGVKGEENKIERAWRFPLDFFRLDQLLFGEFPAYLFGATDIKEIRNVAKKYS